MLSISFLILKPAYAKTDVSRNKGKNKRKSNKPNTKIKKDNGINEIIQAIDRSIIVCSFRIVLILPTVNIIFSLFDAPKSVLG